MIYVDRPKESLLNVRPYFLGQGVETKAKWTPFLHPFLDSNACMSLFKLLNYVCGERIAFFHPWGKWSKKCEYYDLPF